MRDKMDRAWATRGAQPERVIRFRAHVNRITSVRLVVGPPHPREGGVHTPCWLLTGSVDGYVRVWDVNRVLQQDGSLNVTPELAVDALLRSTCDESTCDEDEPRVLPTDPAHDIKRSARAFLVAEVDTGGDVTSIDAQVDPGMRTMTIAVGSYYVCRHTLTHRARQAPCCTNCVCGPCHTCWTFVLRWIPRSGAAHSVCRCWMTWLVRMVASRSHWHLYWAHIPASLALGRTNRAGAAGPRLHCCVGAARYPCGSCVAHGSYHHLRALRHGGRNPGRAAYRRAASTAQCVSRYRR